MRPTNCLRAAGAAILLLSAAVPAMGQYYPAPPGYYPPPQEYYPPPPGYYGDGTRCVTSVIVCPSVGRRVGKRCRCALPYGGKVGGIVEP